ncbi:MAG: hypothetical protein J6Y78_15580 [Paludibacteraceae bacterium]|nr:hypothetical protein [Paludibacteraceae bacterium]
MFKLTFSCKLTDINGNIVDTEKTVVFDNKEELIEFMSGDTDGDNYGSSLIRIKEYDNELYTQIGKVCNHISYLFQNENTSAINKSKLILSSILCNCQIDLWKNKDGSTTDCWFSPILKRYINPNEML